MKQNQIDRSNVNETAINATDPAKSGFNLTYKAYHDFILGRLHPTGYQWIMPADKFSGRNEGDLTFDRIVTPNVSDIDIAQHNFFCTLRSLDVTFEDNFAPNKNNGMSASWSAPSFSLTEVAAFLGSTVFPSLPTVFDSLANGEDGYLDDDSRAAIQYAGVETMFAIGSSFTQFTDMYMLDYYADFMERCHSLLFPIWENPTSTASDARIALLDCLSPFIGENSLLDAFGYQFVRRADIYYVLIDNVSSWDDFLNILSSLPLNEYPIRAYYQIWYEYYRDVNLEPVSSALPNWKTFGSTSIVATNPLFLLTRIRSWNKDMFVSAQPDDICRHVYAPIAGNTNGDIDVYRLEGDNDYEYARSNSSNNGNDAIDYDYSNSPFYQLAYRDVISGTQKYIKCPLPAQVSDVISQNNVMESLQPALLDLVTLRKSQMLENYLKRNYYFGDEYRDRMLAHYGATVSDQRVNRPEYLSGSLSKADMQQEVASIGTEQTNVGDRTATATGNTNGDGYEFFAEEFGIVINLLSIMPKAQYNGLCPQLLLSKQIDFPLPEFAAQNEELGRTYEVAMNPLVSTFLSDNYEYTFGHYPYAHAWRSRVDEVHGTYLSDRQNYTFRRFFGFYDNVNNFDMPKLNYQFIHCRPNLEMFADTIRLDGQAYGGVLHHFFVERVLPTPVENL